MKPIAILGARVIDPQTGFDDIADVRIEDGLITDMGRIDSDGCDIIEGENYMLTPGLIDMRVITGEPGEENRETLASAGASAAKGGVTSIVVMPQTNPVIDDISLLTHVLRRGRETCPVNVHCAGALTQGLGNEVMTEIGLMSEGGAAFFSNGERPISDSQLMRRLLSYSSAYNALIAHRPVDMSLSRGTCAHESDFSARLGLTAAPAASERIMVERDCALAELTGGRLLIDLLSSEGAVNSLRRAKTRDIDIAASVSINHLALNELDIGDYRSFAKLDPPLREESDRAALITAVNDGTIDVIVSSHDPRPAGQKRRPFSEAASGAVGLEILLAAGLTLIADEQLDLMAFLSALTINPATLLGLPSGRICEGAPADLVLIDPHAPWVCDADALLSLSKNTPFDGRRLQGRAVMTIVGGEVVYDRASE
ncbi:MAG: dihydroorotase [Robiginitomaculum sp.]